MQFEGRAVYVTGGGHGIGRAVALRLAAEGASIAVSDIDEAAARQVAADVVAEGGVAFATTCDVTSTESVNASFAECIQRFGRLGVLVNTAGGDSAEPGEFEEMPDELWARKLDLNLTGVARCIRAALPALLASGAGSNVVTVGSINGDIALGGYPYSAAKAGLESLTKNLAARYGRHGLRFNLITPGTIRTRNWHGREQRLDNLAAMYPLGRVGEPADVAAAVAFLASDDAAWITGINLPVDGGFTTGPLSAFARANSPG